MTLLRAHSESMLGTNWIQESNFLGRQAELHRGLRDIVIERGGIERVAFR
jgi:hypothetical protein